MQAQALKQFAHEKTISKWLAQYKFSVFILNSDCSPLADYVRETFATVPNPGGVRALLLARKK